MSHSTKTMSEDLRRRVVDKRLSGACVSVAHALPYHKTVWVVEGNILRKRAAFLLFSVVVGKRLKISDMEQFKAFAKAHGHSTLTQM